MATERTNPGQERDIHMNRLEGRSSVPGDLPDSPEDRQKLEAKETTIDLPDVKDIPGQEFVNAPVFREMADTTASSADEEGEGIFDEGKNLVSGNDADVRPDEREALRDTTYLPTRDEDNLRQARMDNVDFQGTPLNEASFGQGQSLSGDDLDSGDMASDARGDELDEDDEENKDYSLDDTDRDLPSENRSGV